MSPLRFITILDSQIARLDVPERTTVTDYTDIVPITSIRAVAHGETTTRRTFKLSTSGVTGKSAQPG